MWLKSIKENKSNTVFISLITGIIFYLMNLFTPLALDDYFYYFIYNTNKPIENLNDIFTSQYAHYFNHNGRYICHFILQFFEGISNKYIFNIVNTIVFLLFLHLPLLILTKKKKIDSKSYEQILLFSLLLIIILPDFKYTFLWMCGSCNYLFSATLILLFHYVLIKEKKIINNFTLFIFGIICGWTHESFVIGLSIGYLFYFSTHRNELTTRRISLLFGFLIGCTFLIFSPGSIQRAANENIDLSIHELIFSVIKAIIGFSELRITIILFFVVLIQYIRQKQQTLNIIKDNVIFFIAIVIECLFVLLTRHVIGRALLGIEIFSLIILLQFYNLNYNCKLIRIIKFSLCIFFTIILIITYKNNLIYRSTLNQINNCKEEECIVMYNDMTDNHLFIDKFIIKAIAPFSDLHYSSAFNPQSFENRLIAKFHKKDKIAYLPKSFFIKEDFNKASLPFRYVEINQNDTINHIFYKLRPIESDEVPFYQRPFIHLYERYNITTIECKEFYKIKIKDKYYLLLQRNNAIDDRVTDIIVN